MRLYIALVSLSLIWGLSFVFIKVLVEAGSGPWGVVFLRCFFGAVVLGIIMIVLKNKLNFRKLPYNKLLIVGIINAGIPWALIALSEQRIQSSTASILNATTPIWTSVIGFLFFGIVLAKRQWIGVLVGFIGILILMNFNVSALFSDDFIGIGTMILAAMCYGFASQFTKRNLAAVDVVIISFFTLLTGCLLGAFGLAVTGNFPMVVLTDATTLFAAIGLGAFGSGIAYLLFFYMVKHGSAEFATFVTYLVPVTAMFWGYILLDENLSAHLFLGLVLIFLGVFLSSKKKAQKRTEDQLSA